MRKMLAIVGGAGAVLGALLAFFFDKDNGRRRRKLAIDRPRGFLHRRTRQAARAGRLVGAEVYGLTMKATHLRERPKPQPDDATLARKVETEIFRPANAPKATVNVNAENGVVYLRGEVPRPELIEALVEGTKKVQGVRGVRSLLHLSKTPVPTHE